LCVSVCILFAMLAFANIYTAMVLFILDNLSFYLMVFRFFWICCMLIYFYSSCVCLFCLMMEKLILLADTRCPLTPPPKTTQKKKKKTATVLSCIPAESSVFHSWEPIWKCNWRPDDFFGRRWKAVSFFFPVFWHKCVYAMHFIILAYGLSSLYGIHIWSWSRV